MMSERIHATDPHVQDAVEELQRTITARFPTAVFEVGPGEDPEGVYLTAAVDVEDLTNVFDVVADRLVDMQVEEGLPLYVVPVRPLERALKEIRPPRHTMRPTADLDAVKPIAQR